MNSFAAVRMVVDSTCRSCGAGRPSMFFVRRGPGRNVWLMMAFSDSKFAQKPVRLGEGRNPDRACMSFLSSWFGKRGRDLIRKHGLEERLAGSPRSWDELRVRMAAEGV